MRLELPVYAKQFVVFDDDTTKPPEQVAEMLCEYSGEGVAAEWGSVDVHSVSAPLADIARVIQQLRWEALPSTNPEQQHDLLAIFLQTDSSVAWDDRQSVNAHYEHGQWWITCAATGASWAVVDCEKDGEHYYDFEQVSGEVDE